MCGSLHGAPLLSVLYLHASPSWCLMDRPLWLAQKEAMTSGSTKSGFLLPPRCHNFSCFLDTSFQLLVFPGVSLQFSDYYLKMTVLNKLHYWEFPCGVTSFWGKYPLRGQFRTVYSHTSFMLTFLPLAVTWAMSPRRGHVRCPTVWERRNGSLFLIAWMETCQQETQKSTY